jgi:hypothetical protein
VGQLFELYADTAKMQFFDIATEKTL